AQVMSALREFHTGRGTSLFANIARSEAINRLMPVHADQVRPLPESFVDGPLYLGAHYSADAARRQATRIADRRTGLIDTAFSGDRKLALDPIRQWLHAHDVEAFVNGAAEWTANHTLKGVWDRDVLDRKALELGHTFGLIPTDQKAVTPQLVETLQ